MYVSCCESPPRHGLQELPVWPMPDWVMHPFMFSTNLLYGRSQFSTSEHKGLLKMSVIEWSLQWPWRKVLNLSLRSLQGPCQLILITFCLSHLDTCVEIRYGNQIKSNSSNCNAENCQCMVGFPWNRLCHLMRIIGVVRGGMSNHDTHYWVIKDMLILRVLRYCQRLINKPCAIY